jgi:hypothetical protein
MVTQSVVHPAEHLTTFIVIVHRWLRGVMHLVPDMRVALKRMQVTGYKKMGQVLIV